MYSDREILEFDKILGELRKYAVTDMAKDEIMRLSPSNNPKIIKNKLDEVNEASTWIERFDTVPLTGVLNIEEAIKRSAIGSFLSIEELLRVVSLIEATTRNITYIKKIRTLELKEIYLGEYFNELVHLKHVKDAISGSIDDTGKVKDNASEKLSQIRKKIHVLEHRIEEKMNSLLRSESGKLTDQVITIRNNRLVLPVKSEYKNSFKGIIHDQSSSKETFFIEPLSVLEMNNQLQSVYQDELDEIEVILGKISKIVGTEAIPLLNNLKQLIALDVIFAKARYALANQHHYVELTNNTIELKQARHPLIDPKIVVANDINFFQYKAIIITGPNTGGKTVALKTLGLLSIMLQSGLFIPVDEGSKSMVFRHVFCDIGDEQSIEQSLSTFSSHITKIIYILRNIEENSLILLDELGSGTDPKEGASLAMAILNYLRSMNIKTMVTTHYPELKLYAYDLEDTINASVEFDIESLKPTYRLQIGVPGTSNAIDIASRLGLFQEIIMEAKKVSLSFDNDTSNLVKKLEQQSVSLQDELHETKLQKEKLKQKIEVAEQEIIASKKKYNRLMDELEQKKASELQKKMDEIEELINKLDQMRKSGSYKEHELANIKYQSKQLNQTEKKYQKISNRSIEIGDMVKVIPYQRNGEVIRKRGESEYEVQLGVLTSVFSMTDLEFVSKKEKEPLKTKVTLHSTEEAKMELDLRGKRYEEANDLFDRFVDTCLINHIEFAYIIHGYGTLALKKGVAEWIKANHEIKSSRPGGMNEGGAGVTVIYFK